jgi:nitroreductase
VRVYKPDPIPEGHLQLILNAARHAPTAGNNQPWQFLVVRERKNLSCLFSKLEERLQARIQAVEQDPVKQAEQLDGVLTYLEDIFVAPLIIFIFVDTRVYPELVVFDGALAAGNLMLAACALGYGTCFQTTFFPEDIIREHFDIPEHLSLICAIPVGHPLEWPSTPSKKPLHELVQYETME